MCCQCLYSGVQWCRWQPAHHQQAPRAHGHWAPAAPTGMEAALEAVGRFSLRQQWFTGRAFRHCNLRLGLFIIRLGLHSNGKKSKSQLICSHTEVSIKQCFVFLICNLKALPHMATGTKCLPTSLRMNVFQATCKRAACSLDVKVVSQTGSTERGNSATVMTYEPRLLLWSQGHLTGASGGFWHHLATPILQIRTLRPREVTFQQVGTIFRAFFTGCDTQA